MTTRTWDGSTDTAWGTTPGGANDNWTAAFTPAQTEDAVINASAPGDVVVATGETIECKTLTCTGFTGELRGDTPGTLSEIKAYGNVTLAAGMDVTDIALNFYVNGTLISAGKAVNINGQTGITVTLGDDAEFVRGDFAQATLALGTHKLTITSVGSEDFGLNTAASLTWSTGAELHCSAEAAGFVELATTDLSILPPTFWTGDGGMYPNQGANDLVMQSFNGSGGFLWCDQAGYETVGDFIATNMVFTADGATADMDGQTITVGRDFRMTNEDLNNGIIAVAGVADYIGTGTITDMDFSDGAPLYAPNATDGGGNTNVFFELRPAAGNNGLAKGLIGKFHKKPMNANL